MCMCARVICLSIIKDPDRLRLRLKFNHTYINLRDQQRDKQGTNRGTNLKILSNTLIINPDLG